MWLSIQGNTRLDWENAGWSERIDVLDAANGSMLDSRTVSGFSSGQYLVWTIGGHVNFRVTCTGPTNAVVSGERDSPAAAGFGSPYGAAGSVRARLRQIPIRHGQPNPCRAETKT
jgi:hypothetical protein